MRLVLKNDDERHPVSKLLLEWTEERSFAGDTMFRFSVSDGERRANVLIDAREVLYARSILELVASKMNKLGDEWARVCGLMIDRTTYVLPPGGE